MITQGVITCLLFDIDVSDKRLSRLLKNFLLIKKLYDKF